MNVQLLLLLALVGPFCAFTRASPTALPTEAFAVTEANADISEGTEAAKEELSVVTGPPSTVPAAAPEQLATEVVTEVATEVVTEAAVVPDVVVTDEAVVETEHPVVAATAPEPLITEAPVVETAAPTDAANAEDEPAATAAAGVETKEDENVIIEESLSSGPVVGIVIGALLAVIIVIAVVIAAVRRMGKYSP